MEITPEDIENNQIHHCKDDFDDWCTVKNKSKSKRRARFRKKMESALEPIMENVSDDETYFSSSSEEEVQQQPQQKPIELVLKPQTFNSNRNEDNNNKKLMRALGDVFTNRNNLNNMETVRSPPEAEPPSQRSIIDKLHQTLDKDLIRGHHNQWNRGGDCHDIECSMCRKYQKDVSGFVDYFKRRNGIVKPTLSEHDLNLLKHANQAYLKYKKPLYLLSPKESCVKAPEEEVTPLLPGVNLVTPKPSLSSHPTVQPNDEGCAPNVTRETKKNVAPNENNNSEAEESLLLDSASANYELPINTEREEKFSRLEKRLQEVILSSQNMNDTFDSANLDYNMFYSKLVELWS